jgi:hypothetical protein
MTDRRASRRREEDRAFPVLAYYSRPWRRTECVDVRSTSCSQETTSRTIIQLTETSKYDTQHSTRNSRKPHLKTRSRPGTRGVDFIRPTAAMPVSTSTSTSNTTPSTPSTSSTNPAALPPASSQTPQGASQPPASISSHSYHHLPYEERLPKIWRPLVSSVAGCMSKAEKAGKDSTQANCKELNEGVVTFLRTRMELHRIIGHVEAKLQGKAQEMEALEGYVRTQPRLGKRKRNIQEAIASAELQTEMQKVTTETTETEITTIS